MSVQGQGAAEGTAQTAGRRRPVWLTAVSGAVVSVLVVVLGILAVRADGEPVHDVALSDGGIWVSGGSTGYWGRVNTGAHGLDLVIGGGKAVSGAKGEAPPDILQDGRNVVAVTSDRRLVGIDSRSGEPLEGEVELPKPTYVTGVDYAKPDLVGLRGNTLAVVDHDTGRVWAKRLDPKGGTPVADLMDTGELTTVGPNASVTVDVDGDVMAVSAESGTVVEIAAEGDGFGSPERSDLGFNGRAADITAVGDAWVVLDLEKGEVHAEGLEQPQALPGETQDQAGVTLVMATLQQAGPSNEVVAFQTRDEAGYVRIVEGAESSSETGVTSGLAEEEAQARYQRISRPTINGDCLYAAWGDGDTVRWGSACGQASSPTTELPVSGTFSRRYPVAVRHDRGQLLLNDLDTGRVYDLTLPGEVRIDTWPAESAGSTPRVWDPMSSSASPSSTSRPKPSKTSTSAKKKTTKKKGSGAKSPTSTSTKKSG